MKPKIVRSNPTKIHDLRSIQAPSRIVPEPAAIGENATTRKSSSDARSPSGSSSVAPPRSSQPILKPKLKPGKLKSMKQFFFDSSKALVQRMPTLRTILNDSVMKKAAPTPRRSSLHGAAGNRHAMRDFGSSHYQKELDGIVSYRWVIMPRATWKVRWDLWIGLIIFYSVVLIPYRIGFGIDVEVRKATTFAVLLSCAVDT